MKRWAVLAVALLWLFSSALAVAEDASDGRYAPLSRGARGENVQALQERLIQLGFLNDRADGQYGAKTEQAVMEAQLYWIEIQDEPAEKVEMSDTTTLEQFNLDQEVGIDTAEVREENRPLDGHPFAEPDEQDDEQSAVEEEAPEEDIPDDAVDPEEADGRADETWLARIYGRELSGFLKTLRPGDKHLGVKRLKRRLYGLGYLEGPIDTHYDEWTQNAVAHFQQQSGLKKTGTADYDTQARLFSADAPVSQNPALQYYLTISVSEQRVYVYAFEDGAYTELVKTMVCSTGMDATPTPAGEFVSGGPTSKWCYFPNYGCWTQYATHIDGSIYFHAPLYEKADERTLRVNSVTSLGQKASHGCVRLSLEDAKWVYDHCKAGTRVEVA